MKKAIIFHGTGESPESYWLPWLSEKLQNRGYHVETPHYPDINRVPITEFLPKVLQNHTFDNQTILVGHSAGAPLVLSILQNVEDTIPLAVLVAGFCGPISSSSDNSGEPILQASYDWSKIKQNVRDIFCQLHQRPLGL